MQNLDTIFHSSLFTDAVFKRKSPVKARQKKSCLTVGIDFPLVSPSQVVVLVGGCAALGNWDVTKGVKMCDGEFPVWKSSALKITPELRTAEFKFVIVEAATSEIVAWEEGYNRNFSFLVEDEYADSVYQQLYNPRFNLYSWKGAGVAIPVFSLRSEDSMGVGEFLDLKKMVDWAALTDQKIIQVLPINDTTMTRTWQDSYPYNANSIFALHPQFISPLAVGSLKDAKLQKSLVAEGKRLNALDQIDYEAVNNLKETYMRQLYSERGAEDIKSKDFKAFFKKNSYWLESYALFSLLRDKYSTVEFSKWGEDAVFSLELLKKYTSSKSKSYKDIAYYYFVQYHLHLQLVEAREYAQQKGVTFKGDIPIGVSRTSVDAWATPELFNMNAQAGAPPDAFSATGQNWGFPTYNWDKMAEDGYAWWKARFCKMAEYFDAYRIDHILGFFRIWEIPLDAVQGLLGYFSPAMPFSINEMRSNYGFYFSPSYATPDINWWLLNEIFGSRASEVAEKYLVHDGSNHYFFKDEYSSQLKIAAAVSDEALRDGLFALFTEVLFVEDPRQKGRYHPRISAQFTYKYRAMKDWEKEAYNRLYNDFFYNRHNDFWGQQALRKLPALINATNMLTCGEDLGMIPDCVPYVMDREQILSLEIQRMPKDPKLEFGEPWNYPYSSVCTTSTHDMNPIRAWLLEDKGLSGEFLGRMLGVQADISQDVPGWVCEIILKQHLASPAMFTILPLQDWLSMSDELRGQDPEAERINIPANPRHYWRYRMHCTLEQLLGYDDLNQRIKGLVQFYGR